MTVEHQPRPSETNERSSELDELAKQQIEKLKATPENAAEHAEKQAEATREAREVISNQKEAPEPAAPQEQETPPAPTFAARLDSMLNYTQTMTSVQRKLSPASRSFSKVIHAPAIEKTSEALENTVMRPSIVAGATWTAFITGLLFYLVARTYGFTLSGTEMLAALLGGAVLGIVFEGILRTVRHRR
jgi:hypothetical protein